VNAVLIGHAWRANRARLLVVCAALVVWGFVLPVVYATFGVEIRQIFDSGIFPRQLATFGGGDIFSLAGAVALGFIHPISIILIGVYAVGFAAAAVAGERQRGTLEIVLARPVGRRELYATLLAVTFAFVALSVSAFVAGSLVGAAMTGVIGELRLVNVPALWLNGLLLYGSLGAIGLAASVSFDRLAPALGVTLGLAVVMYFLDVLGSIWPDAEPLRTWSLFHYLQPKLILESGVRGGDIAVLAAVVALAIAWALVVFPRRDLAAPS
jgi:ABC-2 type transport system permease protein